MIVFFIGTKAQYIKIIPIVDSLAETGAPFRIVNLGQHGDTIGVLREVFSFVRTGEILPLGGDSDAKSIRELGEWGLRMVRRIVAAPRDEELRSLRGGVAVIHGDTLSTLLSLLLARRLGMRVAHVEAGLRSGSLLHPFPEEAVRRYCMRRSDLLFAPGEWAVENLLRQGVRGKILDTRGNTVRDAIRLVLERGAGKAEEGTEPYCLATFHRVENLFSGSRLGKILDALRRAGTRNQVRLVLHKTTEARIRAKGLMTVFEGIPGLRLMPMQPYDRFLALIRKAEFVLSDGGSIQEECAALGVPCLILRHRTERPDGIGQNAVLWDFDCSVLEGFLDSFRDLRCPPRWEGGQSPSRFIAETLASVGGGLAATE